MIALTDADGSVLKKTIDGVVKEIDRFAYDPWGARRDPGNWNVKDSRTSFIINRGYTGHEHLDAFGIINMNGRVYDPLTAQFFSPDPYVQAPDDWLNYNRYTYCSGNPFKYTDPSGELQLGPFYLSLNIGWSPNGGLSLGISGGVGLEGGLYIGASINYGFKSGNLSGAVNVGAAGFYAYAGYDTKGGWMAGAGYAIPSAFSIWSPINITTNMMSAGIDYSQNGGFSANAGGFSYGSGGFSFNPSIGVSYSKIIYNPNSSISDISAAGLGVTDKDHAAIGTDAQKDAFLMKNGVNLSSLGAKSVEMENTDFPDAMARYRRDECGIIWKILPDGRAIEVPVNGVTYSEPGWFPKSTIYMSPHDTERNFTITLNHEFIHSWQYANLRLSSNERESYNEYSAGTYTNIYHTTYEIPQYNGSLSPYLWPTNLIPVH